MPEPQRSAYQQDDKPEFITLPDRGHRVYPGGYLGCLSARLVRSWLRGDGYERCYLPRGHEGDHDNLGERGRMTWPADNGGDERG